jgi:hypothetical protein
MNSLHYYLMMSANIESICSLGLFPNNNSYADIPVNLFCIQLFAITKEFMYFSIYILEMLRSISSEVQLNV